MSRHLFVDESKDRDYLLVASVHASGDLEDLEDLRKLMRGLVLKGQRRVHMKKESEPRKRPDRRRDLWSRSHRYRL